jgi:hypothetical protein
MKSTSKSQRRKKKAKDITFSESVNFSGVPLPIQNKKQWGSYRPILFKIHNQLSNMLSHHCKVLCLRLDFHVSPSAWSEGLFSHFLKSSMTKIKCQYKGHHKIKRIAYIWARELGADGLHHYHALLAVNGNSANSPHVIGSIMQQEWKKLGHLGFHRSQHHMIQNTVDDTFISAFKHFSYLAKLHTKDEQPVNARNYGASQIKACEKPFNEVAA